MNYETNRLDTFNNWPSSAPVDPIRIAKAGFFYTGDGTEVQCFSCGGKISQWNYGDQVMWRHRRLDPNCPFVLNPRISGNVPLVLGPECPSNIENISSEMALEGHYDSVDSASDNGPTEEDEMYKSDALRLLSFANWDDTSVSREALASAGFYHAGRGRLRCAWCGGELAPFSRFGSLGQPLEVHRMYFPRCEHAASLEATQRSTSISSQAMTQLDTTPVLTYGTSSDNPPQSSGAEHNQRVLSMGGTWRALGVVSGVARNPRYASLAARLSSFERWPADRHQAPRTLAEAGFYYTGTDDQVRCFYCDGGLGKWEAGDTPWSEHAHWFPDCGYLLLVKGQEFVDTHTNRTSVQRTLSAESGLSARRRNPGVHFTITDSQVDECMDSGITLAALGAGLDAARVRRAIARRLRATGIPFHSSEALIDAVLDEQLNEEPWGVSPSRQRLARDILAETMSDFAPRSRIIPSGPREDRPESSISQSDTTRSPSPEPIPNISQNPRPSESVVSSVTSVTHRLSEERLINSERSSSDITTAPENNKLSLEEENRQLKEARLCKVCMDCEVSVVFLPCGHLVSCSRCGAALDACPLCRAAVRALVRAYLA